VRSFCGVVFYGICSDLFPSFSSLLNVFQYLAGVLGYPVHLYHLTPLITSHYFVAVLETPGDILRIYCSVGNIHLTQFVSNFMKFYWILRMCVSVIYKLYIMRWTSTTARKSFMF